MQLTVYFNVKAPPELLFAVVLITTSLFVQVFSLPLVKLKVREGAALVLVLPGVGLVCGLLGPGLSVGLSVGS